MPIHPTAIIDRRAAIDPNADIGPYVVIDGPVTIGARTRVLAHAVVTGRTTLGTDNIVRRVAGTPNESGYAGDGGPALAAKLNNPVDLAIGPDGTLYVSDVYNHCIRAIAPDQTISTVAGICGERGDDGDFGPATKAKLNRPYGVALGPNGDLYIADTHNHRIRVVHGPF